MSHDQTDLDFAPPGITFHLSVEDTHRLIGELQDAASTGARLVIGIHAEPDMPPKGGITDFSAEVTPSPPPTPSDADPLDTVTLDIAMRDSGFKSWAVLAGCARMFFGRYYAAEIDTLSNQDVIAIIMEDADGIGEDISDAGRIYRAADLTGMKVPAYGIAAALHMVRRDNGSEDRDQLERFLLGACRGLKLTELCPAATFRETAFRLNKKAASKKITKKVHDLRMVELMLQAYAAHRKGKVEVSRFVRCQELTISNMPYLDRK